MPTLILIEAITLKGQTFAHAEYFDMTYFGAFRGLGMKNPGYKEGDKRYTFVGRVYYNCISYEYKEKNEPGDTSAPAADADVNSGFADAGEGAPKNNEEGPIEGGRRRTSLKIKKRTNKSTRKKK
jgi:hypothetical protein